MSLFKSREWWYTHAGAEEEYDTCNLCVGNVDNSPYKLGKSRDSSFSKECNIHFVLFCCS